jgi:hypothetical protein
MDPVLVPQVGEQEVRTGCSSPASPELEYGLSKGVLVLRPVQMTLKITFHAYFCVYSVVGVLVGPAPCLGCPYGSTERSVGPQRLPGPHNLSMCHSKRVILGVWDVVLTHRHISHPSLEMEWCPFTHHPVGFMWGGRGPHTVSGWGVLAPMTPSRHSTLVQNHQLFYTTPYIEKNRKNLQNTAWG